MTFKTAIKKFLFLLILGYGFANITQAQTIYDTWQRSQSQWRTDIGLSIGPASGIQIQYFTPRRNTCKVLNKKMGFDFGVYYEGLLFSKDLSTKLEGWEAGGFRGNISFVFFPDLRIEANRFFMGVGTEVGTRMVGGEQTFLGDFIAKLGWELSFMPINGAPIVIRTTLKYNKCLKNDFTYLLPTIGVILGK